MPRLLLTILIGTAVAAAFVLPAYAQSKAPSKDSKAPVATEDAEHRMDDAIRMCIGCHGIPGYKTAFPVVYHVPRIAGQQPGYLLNALKAYKTGERSHPSMRGIAASLSEEDMKKLADHYGAPPK